MVDLEEIADAPAAPVDPAGPYDKELGDLLVAHESNTSALMTTFLDFLSRKTNVFKDEAAEKRLLQSVRAAGSKARAAAAEEQKAKKIKAEEAKKAEEGQLPKVESVQVCVSYLHPESRLSPPAVASPAQVALCGSWLQALESLLTERPCCYRGAPQMPEIRLSSLRLMLLKARLTQMTSRRD